MAAAPYSGIPTTDVPDDTLRLLVNDTVCILGAGMGGLYTALILDSLDIKYVILEASRRAGGRVSTYRFQNGGEYDYFEEGAMRFSLPQKGDDGMYKDGMTKRLAKLIEYDPLNAGPDRLKDRVIPFYLNAREPSKPGFYYFNGIHQPVEEGVAMGSFMAEDMGVDVAYVKAGPWAILGDVAAPFIRGLVNDLETGSQDGWTTLKENDVYSLRGYMASKYFPSAALNLPPQHLPNNVINWCNLLLGPGGAFDRSLTDVVLLVLEFFGDGDLKCFRGGSETLPKKMREYLESKGSFIKFRKRVTAIRKVVTSVSIPRSYQGRKIPSDVQKTRSDTGLLVIDEDQADRITVDYPSVAVTLNGSETEVYGHVISTLPLPVLRTIDLNDACLTTMQKIALRALENVPSVKIGVLFKSDWWYEKLGIIGGESMSDLPIRHIIYPSCGNFDSKDKKDRCKVLTACYATMGDATRLTALTSMEEKEVLKELVLRNLAEAHHGVNGNSDIDYDFLLGEYVDMRVKDWSRDAYVMGAFANFAPGQFGDLYASLNASAAHGCLHFAGEALSTRHAWVLGALDSAWKSVHRYLELTGQNDKLATFRALWGENVEWTTRPSSVDDGHGHDLPDQHVALSSRVFQVGAAYKE